MVWDWDGVVLVTVMSDGWEQQERAKKTNDPPADTHAHADSPFGRISKRRRSPSGVTLICSIVSTM